MITQIRLISRTKPCTTGISLFNIFYYNAGVLKNQLITRLLNKRQGNDKVRPFIKPAADGNAASMILNDPVTDGQT